MTPLSKGTMKFFLTPARNKSAIIAAIVLLAVAPVSRAKTEPAPPAIVIHAKRFEFIPSQIVLKAGRTVRLVFISDDVTHGITVPGLGIDMLIYRHRSNQVVVTPHKTGDFPGKCTHYCGRGHDKMKFMIHVVS